MHQRAPASLILTTMACLILVNLLAAQVILRLFYPASAWQFNLGFLLLLTVAAGFTLERTVRGWRAYLRLLRQRRRA